ncbi:hypothetical protein EIP91_000107 [Steccherinum ochraceum]|uniref:DUF6699 domain-containing protein n=1 Tax=Steccherinum ochraceum TaxID=92696 RepID=A0A4R0RXZ3_9APHY|nr:hypothetical protein EIP91_000107 [Steccherinum ochraceum]
MDGMPPLVDPDAGYPPGFGDNQRRGTPWPATPQGGLWHTNAYSESEASSWASPPTQSHHGWPASAAVSTPQMLPGVSQISQIPQFPSAIPMSGMPVWPQGFGAPAVMTTPMFIPTNPIQDGGQNEEWVHVDRSEGEWRKYGGTPRPRSRSASQRAPSPFSADSSPSSRSSHSIGRSRSYMERISEDDKRPPREWRTDFSMTKPNAFGAAIGSLLSPKRVKSPSIRDFGPVIKSTLHPWLRYSSVPSMTLDLRDNVDLLRIRDLRRPITSWDLTRFTCEPPIPTMRLFSDNYPWYIEVETSNPAGITMHDFFHAIWISTQTPIQNEDYWNCEMDENVRKRIANAYSRRVGDDREEASRGIRRVDFLMDRMILEGLVRTKDGLYELKLKKEV